MSDFYRKSSHDGYSLADLAEMEYLNKIEKERLAKVIRISPQEEDRLFEAYLAELGERLHKEYNLPLNLLTEIAKLTPRQQSEVEYWIGCLKSKYQYLKRLNHR